jgi:hypothetical protein
MKNQIGEQKETLAAVHFNSTAEEKRGHSFHRRRSKHNWREPSETERMKKIDPGRRTQSVEYI